MEELQTDGLELDIVEQMQQMALKETGSVDEPRVKKTSEMFSRDCESTKVCISMHFFSLRYVYSLLSECKLTFNVICLRFKPSSMVYARLEQILQKIGR